MCIIDHYPLGNQRTEISGGLNISEKLGRDSRCFIVSLVSPKKVTGPTLWGKILFRPRPFSPLAKNATGWWP